MGIVLASLGSTATEPSIVTLGTSMYFTYKESIYACDATSGCPSLQPSGALMGPSSPSAVVRFGSEIAWTQTATNSGTVFACNPADCVTKGTLSVDGGLGRAVGLASLEVKSRLVWLAQANADLQLFAWTQPDGFGQSEGASLIPNGTPFGVAVAAVDEGHIFAVVGGRLFGISGGKVSLVPGGGLDDTAIPAAITFAGGLVAWRVGQALHQCETQPSDTMPCKTPTLAVNGTAGTSITALTSPQANTGTPNRMILWAEFDSNSHTSQIKSCMLTAAVDMAMSCASPVVKGQFRFRVKAMYADTAKNQLYVVTRDDRPADGALVTGEIRMLAF